MIIDKFTPVKFSTDELSALVDEYISSNGLKKSTLYAYKKELGMFLNYHRGHPFSFMVEDVESYLSKLESLGLNNLSVNAYLTALRRFCTFLVKKGKLPKNPAKRISYKKQYNQKDIELLPYTALNNYLEQNRDDIIETRNKLVLILSINYFLLSEDICSIKLKDVYRYKQIINIRLNKPFMNKIVLEKEDHLIQHYLLRVNINQGAGLPFIRSFSNRSVNGNLTTRAIIEIYKNILNKLEPSGEFSPAVIRNTGIVNMINSGFRKSDIMKNYNIKLDSTFEKYFNKAKEITF